MKATKWVVTLGLILSIGALGAPFKKGNILVSNDPYGPPTLIELTPDNKRVQVLDIKGTPRDVVVGPNGKAYLFDGGMIGKLAIFDPITKETKYLGLEGWSVAGNLTYGGLAVYRDFLFAGDMYTANGGEPTGVVRFDLQNMSAERFGAGDNIDVNIGKDGLLYALARLGIDADGTVLRVYDPINLEHLRTLILPPTRAIAVSENGDIYTADRFPSYSTVSKYNRDGKLLGRAKSPIGGLADIDLFASGDFLVTSHGGGMVRYDPHLKQLATYSGISSDNANFATIVN